MIKIKIILKIQAYLNLVLKIIVAIQSKIQKKSKKSKNIKIKLANIKMCTMYFNHNLSQLNQDYT